MSVKCLLIAVVLVACASRRPPPLTYPRFAVPSAPNPSTAKTPALVLVPLNNEQQAFGKSAAFLSSLCDWISSTPDVSQRYSSVWLAINGKQDPSTTAGLSMQDIVGASSRSPSLLERYYLRVLSSAGAKLPTFDFSDLARAAKASTFMLANQRLPMYACYVNKDAKQTDGAVLLALEHTQIQPYGPGISYFVETDGGGKHGFLILNGDSFTADLRRVAGAALVDRDEVLHAELSLDIPAEGRCKGLADTACAYVSTNPSISVSLAATAFAPVSDVVIEGWRAEDRPHHVTSSVTIHADRSKARATLSFMRAGTYNIIATIATRTEPALRIERPITIEVRYPSVVVLTDTPEANLYCRTVCAPLALDDVKSAITSSAIGVVSSEEVQRVEAGILESLQHFDLSAWGSLADVWHRASREAIRYEQVEDLIKDADRTTWCSRVVNSITASILESGSMAPADLVDNWTEQCTNMVAHIAPKTLDAGLLELAPNHVSGDQSVIRGTADPTPLAAFGSERITVRATVPGGEDTVPFAVKIKVTTHSFQEHFRVAPAIQATTESFDGYDHSRYRNTTYSPVAQISYRLAFYAWNGLPRKRELGNVEALVVEPLLGLAPWCLGLDGHPRFRTLVCNRLGLKVIVGADLEYNVHDLTTAQKLDGRVSPEIGGGATLAVPLSRKLDIALDTIGMRSTRGWNTSAALGVRLAF